MVKSIGFSRFPILLGLVAVLVLIVLAATQVLVPGGLAGWQKKAIQAIAPDAIIIEVADAPVASNPPPPGDGGPKCFSPQTSFWTILKEWKKAGDTVITLQSTGAKVSMELVRIGNEIFVIKGLRISVPGSALTGNYDVYKVTDNARFESSLNADGNPWTQERLTSALQNNSQKIGEDMDLSSARQQTGQTNPSGCTE